MASTERVTVSCTDPETGETETQELDPHGYIVICGEHVHVDGEQWYGNGTRVITIKPKPRDGG